ncbi:MAG: STAS domain-containing protein [Lentisphaeria bacterium]|nr:STAS domain-containing protein [Lentisphaeria bacterium]
MDNAQLLVAEQGPLILFQLHGRGTLKLCQEFSLYCDDMLARDDIKSVMLDLANCSSMDSTFMGIMVKIGIRAKGRLALLVVNANDNHHELLDGVGVSRVWKYIDAPVPNPSWATLAAATAGAVKDMAAKSQIILEAHQALMAIDPANIPKFQNVVDMIANETNSNQSSRSN